MLTPSSVDASRLTPAEVRALVYGLLTIECVKFEVKNKEKKQRPVRVRPEPPVELPAAFRRRHRIHRIRAYPQRLTARDRSSPTTGCCRTA